MVDEKKATKPAEALLDEVYGPERKKELVDAMTQLSRPDVQVFIRKANDEYWTKDELRRHPLPLDTTPGALWTVCKLLRSGWNRQVRLKRTGFTLTYVINDKILKWLHEFDLQLGATHFSSPISRTDEESYLISSLMEEAIASSQLEGAVTTREKAKQMLREGRKPVDYSQKMVANNYATMQMIKEIASLPLSLELLLKIQSHITRGTLKVPSDEESLRTTDDVRVVDSATGEIVHTPPAVVDLSDFIQDLCDFSNDDSEFIHPLIKASLIHFLTGYIHPFVDGNGRSARSLFYWYLVSRKWGLVEYLSISRIIRHSPGRYARAYTHTEEDHNDATYFILYQLHVVERAVKEFHEYIARKSSERQQALSLLRIPGVSERQARIIQELVKNPGKPVSFKEVQRRLGIQYQTSRLDLLHLEKLGLIVRKADQLRAVLFFATPKLISENGPKSSIKGP